MNWWVRSIKRIVRLWITLNTYLLLSSVVTGCVLISAFASLVGIPIGITSSVVVLKICAITSGTKKYKWIIKKRKKKKINMILLAKTPLTTIEVLKSRALMNLYISNDKFVLGNDMMIWKKK